MKVRLSESMIRFRLDRSEVEELAGGKTLSLTLFPDKLTVGLKPIVGPSATAVSKAGVLIGIPENWLLGWPDSDVVGFDFQVAEKDAYASATEKDVVRIVVEKDFPCHHDGPNPPEPVRMP